MKGVRVARVLLAAAIAVTGSRAAALDWVLVARKGQDAPPVPDAHAFETLADVSTRADGGVYFSNQGSDGSDPALYRWSPAGGVELLARLDLPGVAQEDPAYSTGPGFVAIGSQNAGPLLVDRPASLDACPGAGWVREATFAVTDAGDLVPLSQPGAPVPGLAPGWAFAWGQSRSVTQVIRPTDYAPTPATNANGDLAFFAAAEYGDPCSPDPFTPYANAVFGPDGAGGAALVAIAQQPAPGAPPGAVLVPGNQVALDALGDVAFDADLRLGPTLPIAPALYRWNAASGLELVAFRYGPAPRGQTFAGPGAFALGDGGHLAFLDLSDGFYPDAFHALYVDDPASGVRVVVQRGDPLPGLPSSYAAQTGATFAVNALGDVAFSMQALRAADGAVQNGVWGPDTSGQTVLRLLQFQSAPGLEPARIQGAEVLALSDDREILLRVTLSTADPYDYAFYLVDVEGRFHLLIRNRGLQELTPGALEPLDFGYTGRLQWDPALRHFAALVEDASGDPVIVAEVPEPDALLAGLVAIASLVATAAGRG